MSLTTNKKFLGELMEMAEKMTPEEKAQFRVETRKNMGLPERREPLLEAQESDGEVQSTSE